MNQSFFVCGIIRNSAANFRKNYEILRRQLKEKNIDVYWFFYENDSDDGTVNILKECAKSNKNFHFLSETLGIPQFAHIKTVERAQYMGRCRNKYVQHLRTLNHNFDYMLVAEMDLERLDISNIEVPLSYNADMVGANGQQIWQGTIYYDTWALRTNHKISWRPFFRLMKNTEDRFKVLSCFGGMGLYKIGSIKDCWYDERITNDEYAEHDTLHRAMIEAGHSEMYICPQWKVRHSTHAN